MSLEECDDRARHRAQRPVQGGNRSNVARLARTCRREAPTDVEAPGLEVRAVRGRRQLSVPALGGDPGLAVELSLRRQPEVPGGDVDDAGGQLELVENVFL